VGNGIGSSREPHLMKHSNQFSNLICSFAERIAGRTTPVSGPDLKRNRAQSNKYRAAAGERQLLDDSMMIPWPLHPNEYGEASRKYNEMPTSILTEIVELLCRENLPHPVVVSQCNSVQNAIPNRETPSVFHGESQ